MDNDNKAYSFYAVICIVATAILVIMKAYGILQASWWLMFIPMYLLAIPLVFVILVTIIMFISVPFILIYTVLFGDKEKGRGD